MNKSLILLCLLFLMLISFIPRKKEVHPKIKEGFTFGGEDGNYKLLPCYTNTGLGTRYDYSVYEYDNSLDDVKNAIITEINTYEANHTYGDLGRKSFNELSNVCDTYMTNANSQLDSCSNIFDTSTPFYSDSNLLQKREQITDQLSNLNSSESKDYTLLTNNDLADACASNNDGQYDGQFVGTTDSNIFKSCYMQIGLGAASNYDNESLSNIRNKIIDELAENNVDSKSNLDTSSNDDLSNKCATYVTSAHSSYSSCSNIFTDGSTFDSNDNIKAKRQQVIAQLSNDSNLPSDGQYTYEALSNACASYDVEDVEDVEKNPVINNVFKSCYMDIGLGTASNYDSNSLSNIRNDIINELEENGYSNLDTSSNDSLSNDCATYASNLNDINSCSNIFSDSNNPFYSDSNLLQKRDQVIAQLSNDSNLPSSPHIYTNLATACATYDVRNEVVGTTDSNIYKHCYMEIGLGAASNYDSESLSNIKNKIINELAENNVDSKSNLDTSTNDYLATQCSNYVTSAHSSYNSCSNIFDSSNPFYSDSNLLQKRDQVIAQLISKTGESNLDSNTHNDLASECSSYINKATIEKNSLRNCYVNNLELGTTTEYNDEYDSNGINNIKTNIINEMIHSASNTQSNLELMDNTSLATQCSSYAEYTQSNLDECILNQGIFHEGTDSITSKRNTIIDKIQERGELLTNAASITNEELLEQCASLYVDYDDDERDEYYGKWHKAWQ